MIKINKVPCGYQKEFDGNDIVFVLLHKLLENKEYRDFYINPKNKFNLITLDNSCYEFGKSLDKEKLFLWASNLKHNHPEAEIEIIIPDVYGNKNKTLGLMKEFIKDKRVEEYRLMAVPQGRDKDELIECFEEMEKYNEIDIVGINKLWNRKNLNMSISECKKDVHLLGLNNLKEWYYDYDGLNIRSADSIKLTQLVTNVKNPWEEKLSDTQIKTLHNLIKEIKND